jgi:hypothetical protein
MINSWSIVTFGKFAGRQMSLPQVVLTDPDWFWYMIEIKAFKGVFAREAADIEAKARKIRIPGNDRGKRRVRYIFTREGSFVRFDVIDSKADGYAPWEISTLSRFIDLSEIRRGKSYAKGAGKRLIKCLKAHVFGRTNVRLTKQRCEEFFSDPGNFAGS